MKVRVIAPHDKCIKILKANKKLNKKGQGYTSVTIDPIPFEQGGFALVEYKKFCKENNVHEYYSTLPQGKLTTERFKDMCLITLER